MANELIESMQNLAKALEGGGYNVAPDRLVQGGALQIEDLGTVMHNVTFGDDALKLQQMIKVESCKSTLFQFNRQLSYGTFGDSAQIEGAVGQEENADYVRVVVPMSYYSSTRKTTIVANQVATVDGVKAEEREAANAAKKLAADIEFDLFRGMADFSNAGVFDGNTAALANLPNMLGLDQQIRESDSFRNARDLMFAEYGSDDSVVLSGGGPLTQDLVEDANLRAVLNFGKPEKLVVDPTVASGYNKIAYNLQRINLSGSPQGALGADIRKQFVTNGTVTVEDSNFLRGKAKPRQPRNTIGTPLAPTISTTVANSSTTDANAVTAFKAGQVYIYTATSHNELGESVASATYSVSIIAAGDKVGLLIAPPGSGTVRYYNVYRTLAGGLAGTQKFIGRVVANGASTVTFTDLGNKLPGFVTGFLIQSDTMALKELMPYSRLKMAVVDLAQPEAHFRFCSLAVYQPRKNVLLDNLK